MATEIKVPQISESITKGILGQWLKPNGSYVHKDEPLYSFETDKAPQNFPSPVSGLLQTLVEEGTEVRINDVIARIDEKAPAPAPTSNPAPAAPTQSTAPASTAPASTAPAATGPGTSVSPSARVLAANNNIDPNALTGTGRHGGVIKEDVQRALEGGRTPQPSSAPAPTGPAGTTTRIKMPIIRQRIAERLVQAQQTAAILTTFNEADMSRVMDLRAKYKETFQKKHGVGLGFMSFFVKASIEALKAFPNVNARIDGTEIVQHHYYNIGVAVSTERGLMVPVLRNAERLSFAEVEKEIVSLAVRARDQKITVADLEGGTFTITNGGIFGSMMSTPILNPPQVGILGMHSIQKRAVVVDDQIVIRPMMYLALSYDHRIIDGREAVSFLVRIKDCIENPERILLDI